MREWPFGRGGFAQKNILDITSDVQDELKGDTTASITYIGSVRGKINRRKRNGHKKLIIESTWTDRGIWVDLISAIRTLIWLIYIIYDLLNQHLMISRQV